MWSLRVELGPLFTKKRRSVLGGRVGLTRFGPSGDLLNSNEKKPALLRFHAAYLDEARKAEPAFAPFATLAGEVYLPSGGPRFVLPDDAEIEYLGAPPEDEKLAQKLVLELSAGSFENLPKQGSATRFLRLPQRPETAHFLEVGVELELDGAPEAPLDANDVLDVPLDALSFFSAQVVDDKDEPLSDQPFELTLSDGTILKGNLDADGFVLANPIPAGRCLLRVAPIEPDQPDQPEPQQA